MLGLLIILIHRMILFLRMSRWIIPRRSWKRKSVCNEHYIQNLMKLLVTGGAGFIGSNFIRYWFGKHPDDYITNVDKLTYAGNLENLEDISGNNKYRFVKGDILDARSVDSLVKDTDIIVHFAAESHVDRSISGPAVFVQTNVIGTQVLLD